MAIVVVDDDDDIRHAVRAILEDEGYDTVGATNGREALDMLRTSGLKPCLILLDLMMPEMDGWEFLLRMDEVPSLQSIPVAIMSAHPSIASALRSDGHENDTTRLLLPKPIHLSKLLAVVEDVCSARSPTLTTSASAIS